MWARRKSAAAPPLAMISSARSNSNNGAIFCDDCKREAIINEPTRAVQSCLYFRLPSLQYGVFQINSTTHPWSTAQICPEMRIGRISTSSSAFQNLGDTYHDSRVDDDDFSYN